MPSLALAAAALPLEALIGYPPRLHRRLPHPVVWIGALIRLLEARLNRPAWPAPVRRGLGIVSLVLVAGLAMAAGLAVERLAPADLRGFALLALVATLGLAQRSLHAHVAAVAAPLAAGDLAEARTAVAAIVGRDVERLDGAGVAAAALESLAESFNDGVVAPAFWLALFGLPGLFAYKAVNTAASLIGHREPRWRDFGWAAARTDDAMNLIPARIAGALVCLAAGRGWRTMAADAPRHASPNAGWPEAAMAGGLAVRLGGPAWYDSVRAERATFGAGPAPAPADLNRGLVLYRRAGLLLWVLVMAGALAWPR